MMDKGKTVQGKERSPVVTQIRRSVKDRLGPQKAQSAPVRRQLFSTPSQPVLEFHKKGPDTLSRTYTREERDLDYQRQGDRDTIRRRQIQEARDALEALRYQQEEWDAQLAKLEGAGEVSPTWCGDRESTPQSRHRSRYHGGLPGRSRLRRSASRELEDEYCRPDRRMRVGSLEYVQDKTPAKDIPDPIMQKLAE